MKDENLISTIFNDKKLNKDERYMILTLKYYDNDGDNIIKVTLRELSNVFGITRISKVQSILKALVDKGYISTEKTIGKATNYSFVKEGLIFKNNEDISKALEESNLLESKTVRNIRVKLQDVLKNSKQVRK